MFDSMSNELNYKYAKGQRDIQTASNEGQRIGNVLQATGQVIQQGMSAYAQNKWNSMKYDLAQEASSGIEDYLDVNNENASQDYTKWVTNTIDKRIEEGGSMLKAYARDQRQALIDSSRAEFDKQLISAIDNENQRLFKENEENIITQWNTNRDISMFDSAEVYKLSFKNGMVVREKVELDSPYDETDDRTGDFNHLLNVLYQNACRITDTSSAKQYVDSNIDSIEQKCMAIDIAQLVDTMIEEPGMSLNDIIESIANKYSAGNDRPYQNKEITSDEAYNYHTIVEQYAKAAWENKENQMLDLYNKQVLPALYKVEQFGSYITSDVFSEVLTQAGVDSRFISSVLAKWDNTLKRNDAMWALEDWFDNGNSMNTALTSYQNNYVFKDSASGQWMYNSSAGFGLISGEIDRFAPNERNRKIEEENIKQGEQMLSNYYDTYTAYIDFHLGDSKEGNPFQMEYDLRSEGKELSIEESNALKTDIEYSFLMSAFSNYYKGKSLGADSAETDANIKAYMSLREDELKNIASERKAKEEAEKAAKAVELGITDKALDGECYLWNMADITYLPNDRSNSGANHVVGMVTSYLVDKLKKQGVDIEATLGPLSADPANKGLSDDDVDRISKRANENGTDYWTEYAIEYCDTQETYDLGLKMITQFVGMDSDSADLSPSDIPGYISRLCISMREKVWQTDLINRCDQYEKDVGVLNGTLTEVKAEDGSSVYVNTKATSSSSTSSSSAKSAGGFSSRDSKAKNVIKEETERSATPSDPVAGGSYFLGLVSLFGSKNEDGSYNTMADLQQLISTGMFTKNEQKAIATLTSSGIAEKLFDNPRIYDALNNVIEHNTDDWDEAGRERLWIQAIDYIGNNVSDFMDNSNLVIKEFSDYVANGAVNAFSDLFGGNDVKTKAFTPDGDELSETFEKIILNSGKYMVTNDAKGNVARYTGIYQNVFDRLNKGIQYGFTESAPQSFLSIFADSDFTSFKDDGDIMKACLSGAFYIIGEQTMFNDETNMKDRFSSWYNTLYDDKGVLRETSEVNSLKDKLYNAFATAGALYEIAQAYKKLNDSSLNLGNIDMVSNNNEFHMTSGVTVKQSYQNGKKQYDVLYKDGSTESVDTFGSEAMLAGISREKSNGLTNSKEYMDASWVASGHVRNGGNISTNLNRGQYANATGDKESSAAKEAYRQLIYMATDYSNGIGWDDNVKIKDGQFNPEWCALSGYNPPQLNSGWSINGYSYNYRITADENATFNWEAPKNNPTLFESIGTWIKSIPSFVAGVSKKVSDWAGYYGIQGFAKAIYGVSSEDMAAWNEKVFSPSNEKTVSNSQGPKSLAEALASTSKSISDWAGNNGIQGLVKNATGVTSEDMENWNKRVFNN